MTMMIMMTADMCELRLTQNLMLTLGSSLLIEIKLMVRKILSILGVNERSFTSLSLFCSLGNGERLHP